MMERIFKSSFALIKNNKILLLKEKGVSFLKTIGGKPEEGETEEEALKREVMEEIGIEIDDIKHFGIFTNKTIGKDADVTISVYFAKPLGEPIITEDVEEFVWFGAKDDISLLSPVGKDIITALIEKRYLK